MEQKNTENQEKASLVGYTCARCSKPATLQCPKCLELKLEQDFSTFCSQECFKVWCMHDNRIQRGTQSLVLPVG